MKEKYKDYDMLFTSSGRTALQAVIEDLNLKNSKIILPAFICKDVFSTLIKQNNITPVFVDCPKNSFNISFNDMKKAFNKNKNTKAIVIVHTFGKLNPDTEKISEFCKKNNLILIEDCAHILDLKLTGQAAIFTFNKITNISIGGAYIRTKGKINIKSKPYKLNSLDIYRILNNYKIGKLIIKILRTFKTKNIKINPDNIEIISIPNFINIFNLKKQYKIIPKLVDKQKRDNIFLKLSKEGKKVEKYWIPIFEPENNPNAKNFSDKIINIIR